jgi:hypothetical protein
MDALMPECGLRVFERAMELHIGADCPSKNLEFDESPRDLEFVRDRINATLHDVRGRVMATPKPINPVAVSKIGTVKSASVHRWRGVAISIAASA